MRISLFFGLGVIIMVSAIGAQATPPPPFPKPCDIKIQVSGHFQIHGEVEISIELSNASENINGELSIFLTPGLEINNGAKELNLTLSPSGKSTYEIRAVIKEGCRHIIRAAFSAAAAGIPPIRTIGTPGPVITPP